MGCPQLDKSFTAAADLPPPSASSGEDKEDSGGKIEEGSGVATDAKGEDEVDLAGAADKEDGEEVGFAAALDGGAYAAGSTEVVEGKE